jgi:hypothetical protein
MENQFTRIDVRKLDQRLRMVRMKSLLAIVVGDSHAVARLTCEAARLRDAIRLAGSVAL